MIDVDNLENSLKDLRQKVEDLIFNGLQKTHDSINKAFNTEINLKI